MLNAMLAKAIGTQEEHISLEQTKVKDGFLEKMTFKLIIIEQNGTVKQRRERWEGIFICKLTSNKCLRCDYCVKRKQVNTVT